MSMLAQDLRQSPRVRVARMRIGLPLTDVTLEGNVSCGGVGFEIASAHRLHIGDPITISLMVPELAEPLALSGTVRHVQHRALAGRQYVGARFDVSDPLLMNPLDRFVEETALIERH